MHKISFFLIPLMAISQALTVSSQPVPQELLLKGELCSSNAQVIQLPFDAQLTPIADFNSIVSKNQPLFAISYMSKDNSLAKVIYEFFQKEIRVEIADKKHQMMHELLQIEATSALSYQDAVQAYEEEKAGLHNVKSTLVSELKNHNKVFLDIEHLRTASLSQIDEFIQQQIPNQVLATHDGIFLSSVADTSQTSPAFYKKLTNIARIVDNQTFELHVKVNEKQVGQLQAGQDVDVNIASLDKILQGHIATIGHFPEQSTSGNHSYPIVIKLESLEAVTLNQLRVGMNASVSIKMGEEEMIMIPITAVQTLYGNNTVKVNASGTNESRNVTLGIVSGMDIQITSGLDVGEEIIEHH
ncbi:efflux RND transporter periplasmic adaptor subunit [Candidatus Synchoanobacter obligatus]|uniref:HlyD family efflux transporter periplasmic adaptor subunit n=1 Tax=Candidatus Synchoanobacter obligatus TaxID=2919597 RepID=A0ABT1L482_9GAMM|nr:HlyD family efflux transporter periplasmic adaptor subunit [Candidatus Synchoanobacter obligatus]MCP8351919.1 HlyD family efflux transporter periplasmic adaptor subunit [Candidatus Synchoanobacter obligatus]